MYRTFEQTIRDSSGKHPILIGRVAGQYAKPRSEEFVVIDGKKVHNYKGDNVNSVGLDDREPSPTRLLQGYHNSVLAHDYLNRHLPSLFTSHEGLILPFE